MFLISSTDTDNPGLRPSITRGLVGVIINGLGQSSKVNDTKYQ